VTAITAAEIHFRGSVTTGAAGNSVAPPAAGSNLGKYIPNADMTDNTLNNLFPDTTGDENATSQVDYQGMFVYNANASNPWELPIAWLSAEVAGGVSYAVGWDTTAPSALANASAQGLTIANKNTAPAGVSFSAPTTKAGGVALGVNIPSAQVCLLWVRRTAANTVAVSNDGVTIRVEGDTGSL